MKSKRLIKFSIVLALILTAFSGYTQTTTAIKRVLVEESTGVWCASCAYGSVYFKHLKNNYPNAIPVAIHTGPGGQDPMAILSVELYMISYFSGSPTFLMDRKDFPGNSSSKSSISAANTWEHGLDTLDYYMNKIYNSTPDATIGITQSYNPITREISATITSTFITNTSGNFRLNCFIIEDSVTGGSKYNQANSNFSGWTAGPSYLQDLIDAPAVITGYVHNHVLRAMLGNPEGATASIPTTVTSGSAYSKTFTYTLPAEFDENHISLIGIVQNYGSDVVADREIVNANSQVLNTNATSISDLEKDFIDVSIFPNPINEKSIIEFYAKNDENLSCVLYDVQGREVKELFSKHFALGEYRVRLGNMNLKPGVYVLRFFNNKNAISKRIIINQ